MKTISTLFSGGEGVGVGARMAGLDHLWGVEYDDAIASVARCNGFNTLTGDVRDAVLMRSLPRPDVLHASPVCKNASNAKADGEESPEDIETADAACAYINYFQPGVFTLENVWGYREFTAFARILECLTRNRYHVDYWHLNAADYGVPQTRKRLILVAKQDGRPLRPAATHAEPSKIAPLFDERLPWIGWYAAIEDLIGTLPASKFAKWQLERLPSELLESALFGNDQSDDRKGTKCGYGVITRRQAEPSIAIKTTYAPAAFLVESKNSNQMFGDGLRAENEPCTTVVTDHKDSHLPKAFLMPNFNSSSAANGGRWAVRAALDNGRVLKMTPRALARFQSFPDSYILPDKARLACTVIGNAVPPLLYRRVIEAQFKESNS